MCFFGLHAYLLSQYGVRQHRECGACVDQRIDPLSSSTVPVAYAYLRSECPHVTQSPFLLYRQATAQSAGRQLSIESVSLFASGGGSR